MCFAIVVKSEHNFNPRLRNRNSKILIREFVAKNLPRMHEFEETLLLFTQKAVIFHRRFRDFS